MTTAVNTLGELELLFHDLEQVVRDADDSETLENFQSTIAAQEVEMFTGEHDSAGASWKPLMPSTVKRKRKGKSAILIETGALNESMVHVGASGHTNATSARSLLFETGVEYAVFHQDGTTKMPARPVIGISEETLNKLCHTIADATVEILKGR